MKHVLTTDSVTARERVSFWVDMICSTYVRLECDPAAQVDRAFTGSIEHHRLHDLDLSVVRSGPQTVVRTSSAISTDPEDCFLVATQSHGQGFVQQDGREVLLAAGDFTLYHSTRPYTLRFDGDFEEIVLKVPGAALRSVVPGAESLTALKVCGASGPGRMLHSMLQALRLEVDTLPAATVKVLGESLVSLVGAGLQMTHPSARVEPSALRTYHLQRIRQYIDDHLQDPALTIESVAHRLGMSAGHLHRVFTGEPMSAAQYLWHRRLERCSRDLVDLRWASRAVSEIGFRWGFNDAAHFSRAFRERFGCPPTEWRQRALRDMQVGAVH